ncbi:MAG TPA: restriction endonuclease, partial [Opitutaceae bacterium]
MASAAEPHPLVGASREEVLARYGEPRSTLIGGGREILYFAKERLVLRGGKVVEVERIFAEPSRRPPPQPVAPPATTPAPAADAPAPATAVPVAPVAPQQVLPVAPTDASRLPPGAVTTAGATAPVATAPMAVPEPEPPPEPKLEIKRVLPRGSSSTPSPAPAVQPEPVVSTPPATKPVPATELASPAPAPVPTATTEVAVQLPAATTPATNSDAPTPATTVTALPAPAAEDADALAKEKARRALEVKAARRRLEAASSDANYDPSAAFFNKRTYLITALIVFGGVAYIVWRRRQQQIALIATAVSRQPFAGHAEVGATGAVFTADLLGRLEWKHFEDLVAGYYNKTGVVATRTKAGPNAPVHLKISWKGESRPFALVQCIAQPAGLIPAKSLQELSDVLAKEDIRRGYVVSAGKFSVPARDVAEEKHLTLLPSDIFLEKLNALPDLARNEIMQ